MPKKEKIIISYFFSMEKTLTKKKAKWSRKFSFLNLFYHHHHRLVIRNSQCFFFLLLLYWMLCMKLTQYTIQKIAIVNCNYDDDFIPLLFYFFLRRIWFLWMKNCVIVFVVVVVNLIFFHSFVCLIWFDLIQTTID